MGDVTPSRVGITIHIYTDDIRVDVGIPIEVCWIGYIKFAALKH